MLSADSIKGKKLVHTATLSCERVPKTCSLTPKNHNHNNVLILYDTLKLYLHCSSLISTESKKTFQIQCSLVVKIFQRIFRWTHFPFENFPQCKKVRNSTKKNLKPTKIGQNPIEYLLSTCPKSKNFAEWRVAAKFYILRKRSEQRSNSNQTSVFRSSAPLLS